MIDWNEVLKEQLQFFNDYAICYCELRFDKDLICDGVSLIFWQTHQPDDDLIEETLKMMDWDEFISDPGLYQGFVLFGKEGGGYESPLEYHVLSTELIPGEKCLNCQGVFQFTKDCVTCDLISKARPKTNFEFKLFE